MMRGGIAALVVAQVGCASVAVETPGAGTEPSPPSAARHAPAKTSLELGWVVEARGLPAAADLTVERVARAELLRVASEQVDDQAPAAVLVERSRILVALGVAPKGFDLREAIFESLAASLVGLYDPATGRVLVAADVRPSYAQATRLHELAHALVDQHFTLAGRFRYREGGADRLAALSALAEGDATAVGIDLESRLRQESRARVRAAFLASAAEPDDTDGVPPVVQCLLSAPYREGLEFVEALRADGGWARVDAAWRDPPATTEQVLHPERYASREPALSVTASDSPAPGCRRVYRDTLGESAWRCLLAAWETPAEARARLGGWGGDQVATFDCPEGPGVELAVVGDDAEATAAWVGAVRDGVAGDGCLYDAGSQRFGPGEVARVWLPSGAPCPLLSRTAADRPVRGSRAPQ